MDLDPDPYFLQKKPQLNKNGLISLKKFALIELTVKCSVSLPFTMYMYRTYDIQIHVEYLAAPNLDGRVWGIADAMLATGRSMVNVYNALLKFGKPKKVYVVVSIATPQAIELVQKTLPSDAEIWAGAIDSELTAESYIVPGLGDAGDLAFGEKDDE